MSHSHIPVIVLVTDFYNSLFDAQDLSTFTAVLDIFHRYKPYDFTQVSIDLYLCLAI